MSEQNERREGRKCYLLTTKAKADKHESRRMTENYVEDLLPLRQELRT